MCKIVDKKRLISYNINMVNMGILTNRRCPKCGSIDGQMNAGFNKSGSQRCICRKCKCTYTLNPKYSNEFRQEAIRLYKSGKSARKVEKILKVSKGSVLNWVRKFDSDIDKN